MTGCFFLPLGDGTWRATEHTSGPWDTSAQHGGPPSALLGRAMERCSPRDDMIVARFTCEILGPVPVGDLTVRARLTRPGRSVELLEAAASSGGRDVITARAWRVLRAAGPPSASQTPPSPLPGPVCPAPPPGFGGDPAPLAGSAGDPAPSLTPEGWGGGYLSAVEWRLAHGGFNATGPATVWARLRYPLVDGEETSPLQRVLAIADSGSGASGERDFARWYFINPELTVHLHREAVGEWICLDATTTISDGGAGLATSVISDETGPVGTGAQSLLVMPRRAG